MPPYDPLALFNSRVENVPNDPDSGNWVATFLRNARAHRIIASHKGEVPAVNISDSNDPIVLVQIKSVNTYFNVPADLKLGGGSDHPVEILDDKNRELRIWQAAWDGTRLTGSNASLTRYNNDGVAIEGKRSLGQPYVGSSTGSGLTYLAGLIRPQEVIEGTIKHAIRFAYSSADVRADWRLPAYKSDQHSTVGCPMGTTFALAPDTDCAQRTAPGYPYDSPQSRFTRQVCRAIKRYGLVVEDGTGAGGINIYLEDDATAHWAPIIGDDRGIGNYGFLLRSKDVAYSSPAATRDTDGIPWTRLRALRAPLAATRWV